MGLRNLYLAVDRPLTVALVASTSSLDAITRPTFTQGDTESVTLVLTEYDPAGGYKAQRKAVNLGGYSFRIALGVPGGTPIALQNSWVIAGDQLSASCEFGLNTAGIDSLVSGAGSALSTLSIKVNDGNGWHTRSIIQALIYESVDDNTSNAPTPTTEYYDKVTTDALFAKRMMPDGGSITWTSPNGTITRIQYLGDDGEMHFDPVA